MTWSIKKVSDLAAYKDDWERLNTTCYANNPLLRFDFVSLLLKHFGSNQEYIAIDEYEGRILSLLLVGNKNPLIWQSFRPSQAQLSPTLIGKDSDVGALFPALGVIPQQIDILATDPAYFGLNQSEGRKYEMNHALTMSVDTSEEFDTYWGGRSKKLQQNISRYIRRVNRDLGELEFRTYENPADMRSVLHRYSTMESSGWKGKTGTAIDINNEQGFFYENVLKNFSEGSEATVFELYAADKLVASRFGIASGDIFTMLKTTYDEEYKAYSPGRILLFYALRWLFETARYRVIEFYTNASRDQLQWATSSRSILHTSVYRSNFGKSFFDLKRNISSRNR